MKKMTKKAIKEALKKNGVKGYTKAVISANGWVTTRDYTGKIDENGMLYLKPIDKTDTVSRHFAIQL